MGLLDSIFDGGGGGGGLLDFLRNNALNQQFPSGLPSDQAQYGQPSPLQSPQFAPVMAQQSAPPSPQGGAPSPYGMMPQANAQTIPQQPPPILPAQQPQMAAPTAQAQPQQPSGVQPFQMSRPNPWLGNDDSFLNRVMGNDPTSQALAQQQYNQKAMIAGLRAKGISDSDIMMGLANPEALKKLVDQNYGPHNVTSIGQGYIVDNGKVSRAYTPEQNDNFVVVQTGEDGLGRKTFAKMNKATGEQTPIGAGTVGGGNGGGELGDMNKSGTEYLATLPKQVQGTVAGMLDGTIQPPSSFAAAKPYWQNMIAAAKNVDPTFDENQWNKRRKMSTDIAASGNSSMGGILSNGKSAFKHLAEYTGSAADLGNASYNFPLGGILAHGQNLVGNTLAGSDTNAKIKAINDNLGHYGQESTKFYAGTGGGVEERMNALKEMNPTTTSSAEMAAYAEKEKSLMLDRLREKEAHIRDVMGEQYLTQHPVFTPELQKDIARIDANVAKLRGTQPTSPAIPKAGEIQSGYRFKGGNPADKNNWERTN